MLPLQTLSMTLDVLFTSLCHYLSPFEKQRYVLVVDRTRWRYCRNSEEGECSYFQRSLNHGFIVLHRVTAVPEGCCNCIGPKATQQSSGTGRLRGTQQALWESLCRRVLHFLDTGNHLSTLFTFLPSSSLRLSLRLLHSFLSAY